MTANRVPVAVLSIAILAVPSLAARKAITTVTVENASALDRPAGPVTLGMIFARGDVPGVPAVRGRTAQVDVKRRWPDGSVKHAVLTVAVPDLPKGGRAVLELVPAARPAARRQAAKPAVNAEDVVVELKVHGGPALTASPADALRAGRIRRTWLRGPLVREVHVRAVPADAQGTPDPDLVVRFRIRRYATAATARVAVVVENTKWTSPGGVPYDVAVRVGGRQAFSSRRVGTWPKEKRYTGHARWTRWVKRFWAARRLDDVQVRYDPSYLVSTGLLPRYDPGVRISEEALGKMAKAWGAAATGILQRGSIMAYFPTTGGRPDIGPLPRWSARYLLSQDPRAKAVTWGNADLSGSCPIHVRDPKTDAYIDIDEHSGFSFNARGTRERVAPRDTAGTAWVLPGDSHFHVDQAHQPSLAYVPYLLGGDYYHLEEMGFWAAWNLVVRHYAYRRGDEGIITGQTRGIAWAVRNLLHAAAVAPDGSKARRYFEAKLGNNLRHLATQATAPNANPLGLFTFGKTHAYTRGWPGEWRGRYYSIPPWQHNFLAWLAAHAADQGYGAAESFRDYMVQFPIGLMTHPKQISPHAAGAYFLFIGKPGSGKDAPDWWPRTWTELRDLAYHSPTPPGVKIVEPTGVRYSTYGCSYGHIARGVVIEALRAGRPGAREALRWIDAQLPNLPEVFADDPSWAFLVPPGR